MYQELIARLGELGFIVKDGDPVVKYAQYTGELLPDAPVNIKLENKLNKVILNEDKFYIGNLSLNLTKISLYPNKYGVLRVTNPNNFPIEDIYEMAKQMLDKVMEYNNNV